MSRVLIVPGFLVLALPGEVLIRGLWGIACKKHAISSFRNAGLKDKPITDGLASVGRPLCTPGTRPFSEVQVLYGGGNPYR